tara:strand:- start:3812 stop:4510 length:699 start_codon:yes stop_codon:yes gene_type:complete
MSFINKITAKQIIWGSVILTGIIGLLLLVRKLTPYKKNIVKTANEEWARFGYDTTGKDGKKIRKGKQEYESGYWQRVGDYWKQALNKNYTGKDRDVAWSSAFISWVMLKSGGLFNIPFRKSASHSTYIREYVKNRKDGNLKAPFVAYRLNEKPAEVGDLVCYSREGSSDMYDRTGAYKSHCDIVVAVDKKKNEIEVIGGNVAQSVSKKIVSTDSTGRVNAGGKWFAIIKNNA